MISSVSPDFSEITSLQLSGIFQSFNEPLVLSLGVGALLGAGAGFGYCAHELSLPAMNLTGASRRARRQQLPSPRGPYFRGGEIERQTMTMQSTKKIWKMPHHAAFHRTIM
jgi:hypothetical protein